MPLTLAQNSITVAGTSPPMRVLVACPDARPPAYQAVRGLAESRQLGRFVTGFYRKPHPVLEGFASRFAPKFWSSLDRRLDRRQQPGVDPKSVRSCVSFDLALAFENLGPLGLQGHVARHRTERFDRQVAETVSAHRPDAAIIFSDVGSRHTLPRCRELGVRSILSMVHGDVREERDVLAREQAQSPDFFPMYLADGPIDQRSLEWLHDRRLRDLEHADAIAVPSEHIANRLHVHGMDRDKITVIPYAADTQRFLPDPRKSHSQSCRFLFAGGITQRKGIKYLLQAWRKIRRPGWTLSLLGGLPRESAPLEPYRDEVEFLGRVGHADMASQLAAADVFVFPSLFEGSAVVTYEAMACGLPSIFTAESGSVARDGIEGMMVPAADVETLADRMERLGRDASLREMMSRAARKRAEDFDWIRYHESLRTLLGRRI